MDSIRKLLLFLATMKTAAASCCRLVIFILLLCSCFTATLASPWKPEISAGGSLAPARNSLFQKTPSTAQADEILVVVKRNGQRQPFDQEKVRHETTPLDYRECYNEVYSQVCFSLSHSIHLLDSV